MGKKWADMSNSERAEQTFNDIKARQERRERERLEGIKQADDFIYSHKQKSIKSKNKIRCKSYK